MNSKAIKRQLLAAIAMVLVAAIALGSSTYAWFASNNKVTAEGMKITATTEGANLEISTTSTFKAGTIEVKNVKTATNALHPTHYVTTADKQAAAAGTEAGKYSTNNAINAGDWAHAYSYEYDKVAGQDTYKDAKKVDAVGTTALADAVVETEWALVVPLYLRLNPQSKIQVEDIKATVTIEHANGQGETATGMTTAGRVAFITDKTNKTVIGGQGYATGNTSDSLGTISKAGDDGMLTVYAVIYFDGDDTSCTSANFAADEYTVKLVFEGSMKNNKPVDTV